MNCSFPIFVQFGPPPPPPPPTGPTITTTFIPSGTAGTPYTTTLQRTGGTAPFVWSISSGTLPTGLSLNTSTGTISGTPTTAGTSNFTARVQDANTLSDTQALSVNITAAGSEGLHDFFNIQVARSTHHVSYSLRNQAQLNSLTKLGTSNYYTYIYPGDDYTDPQDGAKLVWPPAPVPGSDSIPGNQQLDQIVLNIFDGNRILCTWDMWYGEEWRTNIGTVGTHKEFQHGEGDSTPGAIYYEVQTKFSDRSAVDTDEIAKLTVRAYSASLSDPAGIIQDNSFEPTGQGAQTVAAYPIYWGRWCRYWSEIVVGVSGSDSSFDGWKTMASYISASQAEKDAFNAGTWNQFSLWFADEVRDPVRILYKVPWHQNRNDAPPSHIQNFWYEHNTSSGPNAQTGTIISYARNFVALKNHTINESDTTLFRKPIG